MYISSIAVVFSSEVDSSMLSTSIHLDYVSGCSLLHAMDFVNKSPIVKSHLKNKCHIVSLTFKYSSL
jgi:hypothetical protein